MLRTSRLRLGVATLAAGAAVAASTLVPAAPAQAMDGDAQCMHALRGARSALGRFDMGAYQRWMVNVEIMCENY